MSKLAAEGGSRVILCSVLPVRGAYADKYPAGSIRQINALLQTIAGQLGATFVDAYDSVADQTGHLERGLTKDGIHLNREGYARLSALVHGQLMRACYG